MCLAIPAEVMAIKSGQKAIVNVGGIEKEISTALLDEVQKGDFVIIHVGYALTRLDQKEAEKTLKLFDELV